MIANRLAGDREAMALSRPRPPRRNVQTAESTGCRNTKLSSRTRSEATSVGIYHSGRGTGFRCTDSRSRHSLRSCGMTKQVANDVTMCCVDLLRSPTPRLRSR